MIGSAPSLRAVLSGVLGQIEYQPGLYAASINGEELRRLTDIESSSISLDNSRSFAWNMSVSMPETELLDPSTEYVKAVMDVKLGDTWERRPCGLYKATVASESIHEGFRGWQLECNSLEQILDEDLAQYGYIALPGTWILEEVRRILKDQYGIEARMTVFPQVDTQLEEGIILDVAREVDKCYYLQIVNLLLAAGGYTSIHQTAAGIWRTRVAQGISSLPTDISYGIGDGRENIVDGDSVISLSRNFSEFANRVILVSEDIQQIPPVVLAVEEDDPANPYSTANWPVAMKTLTMKQIVGYEEAKRIGEADISKRIASVESYSFSTPIDTRRDAREVYQMGYGEVAGVNLAGRFYCQSFGYSHHPPGLMEHTIGKAEWPINEDTREAEVAEIDLSDPNV